LAGAAAELFVTLAADAIAARGRFVVALSGGSTPRATYELLASHDFAARVCWRCVHVFWGDERSAPPDHADSNYRMAREAVLEKVPVPETNIHRICGELPPHEAAKAYTSELGAVLGKRGRFDLVLLGMGADGHTASLFPRSAALDERVAPVVPVYVERLRSWRVTLTLPVINASRNVVFLVRGAGKAGALARIRAGEPLPAGLVQPDSGQLIWLVDQQVITT
jgi:6-phosphogluconolactonase